MDTYAIRSIHCALADVAVGRIFLADADLIWPVSFSFWAQLEVLGSMYRNMIACFAIGIIHPV